MLDKSRRGRPVPRAGSGERPAADSGFDSGECMLDSAIRSSSLLREMRQTLKGSATASS